MEFSPPPTNTAIMYKFVLRHRLFLPEVVGLVPLFKKKGFRAFVQVGKGKLILIFRS